jgi:hypothetical protein
LFCITVLLCLFSPHFLIFLVLISEIFLGLHRREKNSPLLLLSSSLDVIQITLWRSLVHYHFLLRSMWFTIHSACAHSLAPHFGHHCIVRIGNLILRLNLIFSNVIGQCLFISPPNIATLLVQIGLTSIRNPTNS